MNPPLQIQFKHQSNPDNYYHLFLDFLLPFFAFMRSKNNQFEPLSICVWSRCPERFDKYENIIGTLFPNFDFTYRKSGGEENTEVRIIPRLNENFSLISSLFSEYVWSKMGISPEPNLVILIERSKLARDPSIADGRPHLRYLNNHDDLKEVVSVFCQSHHITFLNVKPEELEFAEQVELFSQAKCVIAQHGAGLTNLLWMKPRTNVLEIKTTRSLPCYQNLADAKNLQYSSVQGSPRMTITQIQALLDHEVGRDEITEANLDEVRWRLESIFLDPEISCSKDFQQKTKTDSKSDSALKKEFHAIIATMRSGSSLCGHLLAEAGWIRYAGETQTALHNEDGIDEARGIILKQGISTQQTAPPCDKILAPRLLPDGGRFLAARADRLYILLRHPLAVWRSGKAMAWSFFGLGDLAQQFRRLREITEVTDKRKLCILSYYDLVDAHKRQLVFGRELNEYQLTPQTGEPKWGDPKPLIRTGKIRSLSIGEDLAHALPSVWMDIETPQFQQAMVEYQAILRWVGRTDLDIEFPTHLFESICRMRIEKDGEPASKEEVVVSVNDLLNNPTIPIEDGMLDLIEANEIANHLTPERLTVVLKEFHRLLSPGGRIQISALDLNKVLALGTNATETSEFQQTKAEWTSSHTGERATLINKLLRQDGRKFTYDFEGLSSLLEEVDFKNVQLENEIVTAKADGRISDFNFTLSAEKHHSNDSYVSWQMQ